MTDRSHDLLAATGDLTDSFSGFAVERLVLDPSARTSSTELLEAYQLWGREKGMPKDATGLTFFRRSANGAGAALKVSGAALWARRSRATPECASRLRKQPHARCAAKASCRNGSAQGTAGADRLTGSRSRIRRLRPSSARRRRMEHPEAAGCDDVAPFPPPKLVAAPPPAESSTLGFRWQCGRSRSPAATDRAFALRSRKVTRRRRAISSR